LVCARQLNVICGFRRDGVAGALCPARDLNSRGLGRVGSVRWLDMIELLGGEQSSMQQQNMRKVHNFRFQQRPSIAVDYSCGFAKLTILRAVG
jgi:hypothetical protein